MNPSEYGMRWDTKRTSSIFFPNILPWKCSANILVPISTSDLPLVRFHIDSKQKTSSDLPFHIMLFAVQWQTGTELGRILRKLLSPPSSNILPQKLLLSSPNGSFLEWNVLLFLSPKCSPQIKKSRPSSFLNALPEPLFQYLSHGAVLSGPYFFHNDQKSLENAKTLDLFRSKLKINILDLGNYWRSPTILWTQVISPRYLPQTQS